VTEICERDKIVGVAAESLSACAVPTAARLTARRWALLFFS